MLECVLGGAPVIKDTGPGPQDLLVSYKASADKMTGYYGTLTSNEFISYATLMSDIGISGNVSVDDGWMKLYLDGKTLFVPRRCICSRTTWNEIYFYGLMYGIDGPGIVYNKTAPKNQLVIKSIQGYDFIIRCFKGATNNPEYISNTGATNSSYTRGTEYDRLILNLNAQTSTNQEGPKFANVFLETSISQYVANYSTSVFSSSQYVITRNGSYAAAFMPDGASTSFGWLPVFELVGKSRS